MDLAFFLLLSGRGGTEMANPEKLTKALENLVDSLVAIHNTNKSKLSDHHGYNGVAVNADDLAYMAQGLARRIEAVEWGDAGEKAQLVFDDLADKIDWARINQIPQLFSQFPAGIALVSLLYAVELQAFNGATAETIIKSHTIPLDFRRALSREKDKLDKATAAIGDIDKKLKSINDAYAASGQLDSTLDTLDTAIGAAQGAKEKAERFQADAEKALSNTKDAQTALEQRSKEAGELLSRAHAAFRAATSHGLANAFRAKAFWLNVSMYGWAAALALALALALNIGSERFPQILSAVTSSDGSTTIDWGIFAIQVALAVLSLGAPVWVAWVATKQIGQRFRLAEDYAYKAALSAAYEGYRTEATSLDPLLKAQLFSIALTRLDEIPLRLIEQDVAGSPLHDLLNSREFRNAAKRSPDLKAKAVEVLGKVTGKKPAPAEATSDDPPE